MKTQMQNKCSLVRWIFFISLFLIFDGVMPSIVLGAQGKSTNSVAPVSGELGPPAGLTTEEMLSSKEQELTIRARSRSYPGGKDEESLKIQARLKATEAHEEPADPAAATGTTLPAEVGTED